MKLHSYPETDSLHIELRAEPGIETREVAPGLNADLDAAVDVVGLDPGRVGGITGFALSCDLLEVHRRQGNAHAWSTAIDTAASLALSWAKPVCRQLEEQPFKGPLQADLIGGAIVHENGSMPLPQGHGLGIEVDQSVVDRFEIAR